MWSKNGVLMLSVLRFCYCDWVSDWMTPVQDEFGTIKDLNTRKNDDAQLKMYEDEELRIPAQFLSSSLAKVSNDGAIPEITNPPEIPTNSQKTKLQATLEKAKTLAEALKEQILAVTNREAVLKEAIANGRSGVSSVTVYTLEHAPRSYLIRDGFWTVCTGAVKPAADNPYSKLQSSPRCLGVETPSKPDPCVFNSVIKYETIPTRRRVEYAEEDFLCLKSGFNNTIEQYLSVPKRVVNETCKNGMVRSLEENVAECGLRVLSEYLYYPSSAASVPMEYCVGACHLLAAWHLSNTTIENFEFLKDEPGFKKYFIKSDSERLI